MRYMSGRVIGIYCCLPCAHQAVQNCKGFLKLEEVEMGNLMDRDNGEYWYTADDGSRLSLTGQFCGNCNKKIFD